MATIVPFSVFSCSSIEMAVICCGIHTADSFVFIRMLHWQRGLVFFSDYDLLMRKFSDYVTWLYWLIVWWRKDEAFVAVDLNSCASLGFCGFWCLRCDWTGPSICCKSHVFLLNSLCCCFCFCQFVSMNAEHFIFFLFLF